MSTTIAVMLPTAVAIRVRDDRSAGLPPLPGVRAARRKARAVMPEDLQRMAISETAWFRSFIRAHHDDPIAWPTGLWLVEHGEGATWDGRSVMVRWNVGLDVGTANLLKGRAHAEGKPTATVLRRLICQHFGVVPMDPAHIVATTQCLQGLTRRNC